MTANLSSQGKAEPQLIGGKRFFDAPQNFVNSRPEIRIDAAGLAADKFCLPEIGANVARPRLREHLTSSLEQFGATLVTGRAGTGKTSLVAEFARNAAGKTAWFKVESIDNDWEVFSSCLANSVLRCDGESQRKTLPPSQTEVWQTTETLGAKFAEVAADAPLLVVLDDAHAVFDADWFAEFFQTLLPTLVPNVRLLICARSLPPLPLWRMRSKRMLGVIDESLLAFTPDETADLFGKYGLSKAIANVAHRETYGRAAKLKQCAESFMTKDSDWIL